MSLRRQKNVALVCLLVLVIVLIFQNTEEVETEVLFWQLRMPRALLLGATFVFGTIAGYLLASLRRRRAGAPEGRDAA